MNKTFKILALVAALFMFAACKKEEKAADTGPAALTAPTTNDDAAWKEYLKQVVIQNMGNITNNPFMYYLPAAPAGTPPVEPTMPPTPDTPAEGGEGDAATAAAEGDAAAPAAAGDTGPSLPDSAEVDENSYEAVYNRLLEKAAMDIERTVVPGNMLAFGSSDSVRIANLAVAAFQHAEKGSMQGVRVLFVGKAEDSARVKAAVEPTEADYVFVEAK